MDNNYQEMFDALDVCYDKALVMPCLVLIYTIIDSISWLAYGACEQSSKKRFILWVEKYYLGRLEGSCDSIDLYAARCSILHGLSWESNLTKDGKAKRLFYAIGRNGKKPGELDTRIWSQDQVASMQIDSMISSLKLAMACFFEDAKKDDVLSQRLENTDGQIVGMIRLED
ncbi:hypothetical protein ACFQAT_18745 [Undibacterium arcticum]|uniref:Uncharacterized protein n=1 Tax=Undibacterium arcticum TaxID=1762892 RepID=A0ABV7F1D8_9BURK